MFVDVCGILLKFVLFFGVCKNVWKFCSCSYSVFFAYFVADFLQIVRTRARSGNLIIQTFQTESGLDWCGDTDELEDVAMRGQSGVDDVA